MGVGWERRLSSAFPPAPPRLHPRPGATLAPRPVASSPVSLFRPTSPPCSFEVGSEGSGRGRGCSARPHPIPTRLCPWRRPRLPSPRPRTSGRGFSGRVSRAVRPDGWRLPAAGPLACPSPPAAGPGLVCLSRSSAALGLPRGRQAPPHALRASGLAPNPPSPRVPRLSCPVLSPLTSVVSLARLAPRCLSEPLPSALGGGGRRMPGGVGRGPRWLRGEVGGVGGAAVRVELFFFF